MSEVYYTNPQRAAEESRWGKALSDRVRVNVKGHSVLAQIVYFRGDYQLTYAGLKNVPIRGTEYFSIVDSVKRWKPL